MLHHTHACYLTLLSSQLSAQPQVLCCQVLYCSRRTENTRVHPPPRPTRLYREHVESLPQRLPRRHASHVAYGTAKSHHKKHQRFHARSRPRASSSWLRHGSGVKVKPYTPGALMSGLLNGSRGEHARARVPTKAEMGLTGTRRVSHPFPGATFHAAYGTAESHHKKHQRFHARSCPRASSSWLRHVRVKPYTPGVAALGHAVLSDEPLKQSLLCTPTMGQHETVRIPRPPHSAKRCVERRIYW